MAYDLVGTYKAQDIAKAREQRDELKAKGYGAYMTRAEGTMRYDALIFVFAEPPKMTGGTRERSFASIP